MKLYLTTYLSKDVLRPKRIRRRRLVAQGTSLAFRLARIDTFPTARWREERYAQVAYVDGTPVAYMGNEENWFTVEGDWWGNGLSWGAA